MRSWIEIDLGVISQNFDIIRDHISPSVGVIGVIKSDAYGHGIQPIAKLLERKGALALAVISLEEALLAREVSKLPILILGYLDDDNIRVAIEQGFVLSLYDQELAHLYDSTAALLGKRALVHLKVETGLNRLGMTVKDAEEILMNQEALPNLKIEAIYSHLSSSSNGIENQAQLARFEVLLEKLNAAGIHLPVHMANSHALPNFRNGFFQAVRLGLALYGVDEVIPGLQPSLQCKSVVIQRKMLEVGDSVSYNKLFTAERKTEIAVLAMGYGEGLSQGLTGKLDVLINGHRVPVIGQICMNLCIADVTGIPAKRGDEAVFVGRQTSAEGVTTEIKVLELAKAAGLRHHEILCRFGRALPRVYVNDQPQQALESSAVVQVKTARERTQSVPVAIAP